MSLVKPRETQRISADMLPVGCLVKLPELEDWFVFEGFHEPSGLMHLSDGLPFTWRPDPGETFVWTRGAF